MTLPDLVGDPRLGGLPDISPADRVFLALLRLPDEAWARYKARTNLYSDRVKQWMAEQEAILDAKWGKE